MSSSRRRTGGGRGPRSRGSGAGAGAGAGSGGGPRRSSSSRRPGASPTSSRPFTDASFPPERSSICHDWAMCPSASSWGKLVWKRASSLPDACLFSGGIGPADINQGALGNCYFLSALSVLAEVPARIERLFTTNTLTANGEYTVQWYQDGHRIEVTIDDYLPCDEATGLPAFAHTKGGELWVALLEKAWAKVHGSYQAVEGGDAGDVMSAFTGAPHTLYPLQSKSRRNPVDFEAVWMDLLEAERRSYVMAASTKYDPTTDLQALAGLVEGHAMALLSAHEAEGHRLVKIRNPWGRVEWNGAWSDKSPLWTASLKRRLGWTDAPDGTFFMAFSDVCKYFAEVSIARVREDSVFTSLRLPSMDRGSRVVGIDIEVPADAELTLELHQPSKRCYPKDEFTFEYGGLSFQLFSQDGPPVLEAAALHAKSQSVSKDAVLRAGRYLAVVQGEVPKARAGLCNLSAYASTSVRMSVSRVPGPELMPLILPALEAVAVAGGEPVTFGPFEGVTMYEYDTAPGLFVLAYVNKADKAFIAQAAFDTTNMQMATHNRSFVDVRVAAGATQTVVLRVKHPGERTQVGYTHSDLAWGTRF